MKRNLTGQPSADKLLFMPHRPFPSDEEFLQEIRGIVREGRYNSVTPDQLAHLKTIGEGEISGEVSFTACEECQTDPSFLTSTIGARALRAEIAGALDFVEATIRVASDFRLSARSSCVAVGMISTSPTSASVVLLAAAIAETGILYRRAILSIVSPSPTR